MGYYRYNCWFQARALVSQANDREELMDGSRTGIADWPGSKLFFGSQQDRIVWVSDVSVRCLRVAGVGVGWVLTFWVAPESNIVPKTYFYTSD